MQRISTSLTRIARGFSHDKIVAVVYIARVIQLQRVTEKYIRIMYKSFCVPLSFALRTILTRKWFVQIFSDGRRKGPNSLLLQRADVRQRLSCFVLRSSVFGCEPTANTRSPAALRRLFMLHAASEFPPMLLRICFLKSAQFKWHQLLTLKGWSHCTTSSKLYVMARSITMTVLQSPRCSVKKILP